jgi:hypothetical protein
MALMEGNAMETSSRGSSSSSRSIKSTSNNNYVAISEYRAALSGIENRLHQIQNEGFKNHHDGSLTTTAHNDSNNNDDSCGIEIIDLLEKAKESLTKHLARIVRPLDNQEYNAMIRIDDCDENGDDDLADAFLDDDFDPQENDDCEDEHNYEQDFDAEDLIDQDAVLRVTKLRDEVRAASQQLALYRDSVTLKALELADQQIRLVTTSTTEEATTTVTMGQQGDHHDEGQEQDREYNTEHPTVERLREEFATATSPNAEITQLLTDRLNQLTRNLNSLDLESPAQLLQETLDTVEMVQQEPLSQTERAIRSRNNEGMQFSNRVVEDPVERLNNFLG